MARKKSFYTANGWQGKNYDSNIRVKEIAKIVRQFIKKEFKGDKWSVTSTYNTIKAVLMESYDEPFKEKFVDYNINHYWIEENEDLTDVTKAKFIKLINFINTYNFDDSDGQIDYFSTNFYLTVRIGKWDKPFKLKK